MAAAKKLPSLPLAEVQKYQSMEIGPDDLVTAADPISEGVYLSQTNRQYQNRPRMTRGQHEGYVRLLEP
jgi:hypothetical protein